MHLYRKYQSPNTFGSKDVAQVKVVQNQVKVQDKGQNVTSIGTMEKGLFIISSVISVFSGTFGDSMPGSAYIFSINSGLLP